MKSPFKRQELAYEKLYNWWKETISDNPGDKKLRKNRGERAQLVRCATPSEVLLCPAFYVIAEPLEEVIGGSSCRRDALAAVIGLLAHVRNEPSADNSSQSNIGLDEEKRPLLPRAMADRDGIPVVSVLRFRRLLEAQNVEELYPLMRRILMLLNKTAHISDLAVSIYEWNNETRKRWAYEYFVNAPKKSANA